VSAFGVQFGKVLLPDEQGPIPLGIRFGGNLQSLSLQTGSGDQSSGAAGATFTVGMPFQQDNILFQPVGTFGMSILPIDRDENGDFVHGMRPSATAGMALGVSSSGLAFVVEPVVSIPIVDEQSVAYGVAVSILASIE
jgi:hypothetical protein